MLKKPIIIGNWTRGMKLSPYQNGFPQMRGIDPLKVPGVASIERAFVAAVANTDAIAELVNWMVTDNSSTTYVYALTADGKLWKVYASSTKYTQVQGTGYNGTTATTAAHGNGLVYWKGCIWVARDRYIDYYDIANTTWHYAAVDLGSGNVNTGFHPMIVGQDDRIYIGCGPTGKTNRYVGSIYETVRGVFDKTSATAPHPDLTSTATALTLPEDYNITCFAELGDKLIIGTKFGLASVGSNVSGIADIFPWSRDTTESFSLPIRIIEEGINSIIVNNNLIYISAGTHGNIYISNGTSVSLFSKIPLDNKDSSTGNIFTYPNAIDFLEDNLIIGASQGILSTYTLNPMGVYFCRLNSAVFVGNNSHGLDGSNGTAITISSIYVIDNNTFFVAWRTTVSAGATTYGIDYYSKGNNRVSSYGAYAESEMFIVGTGQNQAKIEFFNFYLSRDFVSGDGVVLKYRTSVDDSWTTIATFDFATYGAVSNKSFTYSIPNLTQIQFRVELTCSSTTTPELIMIAIQ